jgi:hypothetical protein
MKLLFLALPVASMIAPLMTDKEILVRQKLKNDFGYYAKNCLKIRQKSSDVASLQLNDAQKYIHSRVEDQLKTTGKVRAIILKGRQQGCSTYIEGRFYWRVTHAKGVRAFILTHEEEASNNLFEMAQRYHENCPVAVRPSTGAANAKELHFDKLDSGYKIGTAGNKSVGRSSTVQLFHGSEVAFWPNAQQHAAGIMQALPDIAGTESFLESTANGIGNFFHEQWQKAEAGESDYIPIFVPWFWQPEYRKTVLPDFALTDEETLYKHAYGLDYEQMAWRRAKIAELNDELLFKQEYPATAAEAFQSTGSNPLITPEVLLEARKCPAADAHGAKVLGVDPARFGDDRTSICFRQGRVVHWIRSYSKKDTMEVVGLVKMAMDEVGADKVFVDIGGLGAGVYDRLIELVDRRLVVGINSGEVPINAQKYFNKRAEMWGEMKEWLAAQPAKVPDIDELQADLTQIRYSYDSNSRMKLERKEEMKKRGFRSPDMGDALSLTFAQPVRVQDKIIARPVARSGGWMG